MAKFSKDGQTFYEIPDDEENLRKATEKGYRAYMDVTKDGKSTYTIPADPVEMKKAEAKGYQSINAMQATQEMRQADYGDRPVAAAAMGAANTMSWGLSDEIGGVAHAIANPSRPIEAFKEGRDQMRTTQNLLAENNQGATIVGGVAGGVFGPAIFGAGKGAVGLLKGGGLGAANSAVQGAGTRLGNAEGDVANQLKETFDPQSVGTDLALGGILGTGGAAISNAKNVAAGIKNAGSAAVSKVKPTLNAAGEVIEAFKEGSKDYGSIMGTATGTHAAVKKALSLAGDSVETAKVANGFKKNLGPGHFRDMTDEGVIAQMVEEGNEQALNFVAHRTADYTKIDVEDIKDAWRAGAVKRSEARDFDFNKAGEDIVGDVENLSSSLKSGTKARRSELEGIARNAYQGDRDVILGKMNDQLKDALEFNDTKGAAGSIQDAIKIISQADPADNPAQFDALLKSRQRLDDNIDWVAIRKKSRAPTKVEMKLIEIRSEIDQILKGASDAKVESDGLYGQYANLEKRLLNKTMKDGEFDKYEIGKKLTNREDAQRFRDNLDLLNEFADQPGLSPDVKEKVLAFRDKFATHLSTADLKRTLNRIDTAAVGSSRSGSPAQLSEAMKRGDGVLAEMTKTPNLGLKSSEKSINDAEKFFGKKFSEMNIDEKTQIINFRVMLKKNPDLNFVEYAQSWSKAKPKGTPGQGFNGGSTLNDLGDFAAQRAVKYGADQAYNAVTGEDEGAPDPFKEQAVEFLKEKYNLSDAEAKVVKRMMPGLYDMAGMVKAKGLKMKPSSMYKPTKLAGAKANTDEKAMEDAIDNYVGSGYFNEIRKAQKDGKNLHAFSKAQGLKGVTEADQYSLEKPTSLYRYHTTEGYNPEDLKIGDEMTSDRLLSFTKDKSAVKDMLADAEGSGDNYIEKSNVIFKINRSTHGGDIGGKEAEVLMPEGLKYEVSKISYDKSGKPIIELKEKVKRDLKGIAKRLDSAESVPVKAETGIKLSPLQVGDLDFAKSVSPARLESDAKRIVDTYAANQNRYISEDEKAQMLADLIKSLK